MLAQSCADRESLLVLARSGDHEAWGTLLDRYRNHLKFVARGLIGGTLRLNLDASDLVQQTFLEAHRDLAKFHGSGNPDFVAWLRQILVHNLAHQAEFYNRQNRGSNRQVSLDDLLENSNQLLCNALRE